MLDALTQENTAALNKPLHFNAKCALADFRPSRELKSVSAWIARIQKLAKEEFGYGELWIAGGSSRTILDHVYFQKPLKMRDLDIFFVAGKKEEEATAWRLAENIEKAGIARFERKVIRPKARVNPHLPHTEQLSYKAGYGIHLVHDTFPILSLSIFHEMKDLELNGIMNVDKIRIRLDATKTLTAFCANELVWTPYWKLTQNNIIEDKFNGYQAWVEKRPEILNWLSLNVEPPMKSIRVLRSFAKCGHAELSPETKARFQALVQNAPAPKEPFEMMRSFLKILSDRLVAPQLAMLASIGTLKFLSPELQRNLEGLTATEIEMIITVGRSKRTKREGIEFASVPEPLQVLEALTWFIGPEAKASLMDRGYEAYPTTFT